MSDPVWNGEVGHNNPPGMAETAGEVTKELSNWMSNHPAIETEEDAREAKVYRDRAALCVKDLEDERKLLVQPLNERVAAINETYKGPRSLLEKVLDELKMRIGRFIEHEERKRIEAADRARALAEDAARVAREAERVEQSALDGAASGELDVNVADVTASADRAFADYQKAERQAQVLARETKVRISGGFTRALGLKTAEVVWVDEPVKAVADMEKTDVSLQESLIEAILIAAKKFKRKHGRYPEGIKAEKERRI